MSSVFQTCPYCRKTYKIGDHCPYCLASTVKALSTIREDYHILTYIININNSIYTPTGPHTSRHNTISGSLVRMDIMDLVKEVKDTVYEFAHMIGIKPAGGVKQTCSMLLASDLLSDNPMTSAYSKLLSSLAQECQEKLSTPQGQAYNCLNPSCRGTVRLLSGQKEGKCPKCGSTWTRVILEKTRNDSILHSGKRLNATDLSKLLSEWGFRVTASTIRSWAHEGKISPATKQGYKVSEVYLLKTSRQ